MPIDGAAQLASTATAVKIAPNLAMLLIAVQAAFTTTRGLLFIVFFLSNI
jgi:hypothetical protein